MRCGDRVRRARRFIAVVATVCSLSLLVDGAASAMAAPVATGAVPGQAAPQSAGVSTGLAACTKKVRKRHLTKAQIRKRERRLARRCRAAQRAAAAAAAAAQQAALAAIAAAKESATPAATTPCGPSTYLKADGSRYACSFSDEFAGSTLDSSKWTPVRTAVSGQRTGYECVVDDPGTLAVADNALSITARRQAPFTCPSPYGDFSTSYTGGMISSWNKFAQTYGRFEIRARFPGARVPGLQASLWLFPQTLTYGAWPASGEIDLGEWFSGWGDRVIPRLHYVGSSDDANAANTQCMVADANNYHSYVLEWTPTSIEIKFDGVTCLRNVRWLPLGLLGPAPFDHPFVLILAQGIGFGTNAPTAETPFPATTQVDYVRVWR